MMSNDPMQTESPVNDLEQMLETKRHWVDERKLKTPMEAVRAIASLQRRPEPLLCTVTGGSSVTFLGLIGHAGKPGYDPVGLALRFKRAGIDGISLQTDAVINSLPYAEGIDDLALVTRAVRAPVVWQDYVVDEYQVIEARAAGASAVTLSAQHLDGHTLRTLISATQRNRMAAMVTVADLHEMTTVLAFSPQVISIGGRSKDGTLNLPLLEQLRAQVPSHIRVAIAPALKTLDEARSVAALHPDAVMVAASWISQPDGIDTLRRVFTA